MSGGAAMSILVQANVSAFVGIMAMTQVSNAELLEPLPESEQDDGDIPSHADAGKSHFG